MIVVGGSRDGMRDEVRGEGVGGVGDGAGGMSERGEGGGEVGEGEGVGERG